MTTTSPFDIIKETLNIADITAFYGIEVKRNNQTLCPLHKEKTPSFTIYPDNNSWHCFGCGAGGSVIDFVMQMHGTDALGAAKKLDADYNLGLFDYGHSDYRASGYRPQSEEAHRISVQRAENQAYKGLTKTFEAYMDKVHTILCNYLHLLEDWKTLYAPKTPEEMDTVSPLFIEACHQLDYIEYLLDCLTYADYDEQIRFYQLHRKEMAKIATKIKQHAEGPEADASA